MSLMPGLLFLQPLPAVADATTPVTAAAFQGPLETPKQAFGSTKTLPTLTSSEATRASAATGTPSKATKTSKKALPQEKRAGVTREKRASGKPVSSASAFMAQLAAEPPCGSYEPWRRSVYVAVGTYVSSGGRIWRATQNIPANLNFYPPHEEPTGWQLIGNCPPPPAPSIISMEPDNGLQLMTTEPTFSATAITWSGGTISFDFEVCESPTLGSCRTYNDCCWSSAGSVTLPEGALAWGRQYWWRLKATDASTIGGQSSYSEARTFIVGVRQPTITSQLSTPGVNGQEFHQASGNYTTTFTDVQVPVAGPPLSVVRSYNSMDSRRDGVFGAGWSTRWDMSVVEESIRGLASVLVTYPDGRQVRFAKKSDGAYQPPPGMFATLAKNADGSWRLMDKSSTSYVFDSSGRLLKVTDQRGRTQNLQYGSDGKLAKATAPGGRSLSFTWSGAHVGTVTTDPVDGKPLTWNYTYNGDVLEKVCNPAQGCTVYSHNPGSLYRSTVLDSDPMGYWRFGETTGRSAKDLGWLDDAFYNSDYTLSQPGALAGTPDTAVGIPASTTGAIHLPAGIIPRAGAWASIETWFKTAASGTIMTVDGTFQNFPMLQVTTDGKLAAGYDAASRIVTTAAVKDNAWHHAVLTAAGDRQTLYVDGVAVGTFNGEITNTSSYYAEYMTLGGISATVDELAVYDRPLSPAEIARHYAARAEALHKLTKITLPSGRIWAANTYDPLTDRIKTHTDDNGGTWQLSDLVHDEETGLSTVTVTDPNLKPLVSVHDAWRGYRIVTHTDQLGKKTNYSYDTGGYLSEVVDANNNAVSLENDKRGNAISQRTCRDVDSCQIVRIEYYLNDADQFDPRNDHVVKVRDARSASDTDNTYATVVEYNTYGEQTKQTTPATPDFPNGRSATVAFTDGTEPAIGGGTTPAGLVKTRKDPKGNVTELRYTASGDLAEQIDPSGLITKLDYDSLGRAIGRTQISAAHPSGVKTTFTYDDASRPATQTDSAVKNEISGVTHTAKTTYTYDADGNPLTQSVSDLTGGDASRTVTYAYDAHGRQDSLTDPAGGVVRATWNKLGLQETVTDPLGSIFGYTYTERGQLASRKLMNWTGSPVNPQPAKEIVLESYSYDDGGRLAAQVDAMGRKTSYTYYGDNRQAQVTGDDVKLNGSTTTKDVVLKADTYDAAGNLIKQVIGADPITGVGITSTESIYDAAGRLTSTTLDPAKLKRKTAYVYDANNLITKETRTGATSGTREEIVSYAYNAAGLRTRQTIENGTQDLVTTWTIDDRGLITAITDPRGNADGATAADYTTTNTYDALGRQIETKAPNVEVGKAGTQSSAIRPTARAGYDTFGNQTNTIDAEGGTITTAFDKAGRAVNLTMPTYTPPGGTAVTPTISHGYDAAGRRTTTTDPRGYVTTTHYDALGNPVRQIDPGPSGPGGAWIAEFNLVGEQLSAVDPNGARMEATFDDLGRKITETVIERKPTTAAYTTKLTYNDAGMLIQAVEPGPGSKITKYVPNAAGEIESTTDPAQNKTTSTYDLAGRPLRVTDATANATETSYDLAGRPIEVKGLNGSGTTLRSTKIGYDLAGNPTSQTSAEQHTTQQSFDALNRLTTLTEPVSANKEIVTRFGYDANGARTKLTDGRGNTTWTTYNSLGLIEKVIEPATTQHPNEADRTWVYGYDKAGNNTGVTQPGGVQIIRTFDHLGRLAQEDGSGGGAATAQRTFGYDTAGQLTAAGDYTLEYNDRGLLTKLTQPSAQPTTMAYDDNGNLAQRVDAAGTTTFTWDNADRLKTATDPLTGRTFTYAYDKANRVETLTSANPANTQIFGYDDLGRATSQTLKNSAGAEIAKITYGWDKDDNLTTKTTTGLAGSGTNTYGYDHANRLTSWTAPGGTTTYEWDAAGNRTKVGDKTFTYDERNRLTNGDGTDYTYTARGTLASQTKNGTATQLTFDAFDRLIADGDSVYAYDVFDRVTSRISGPTKQTHLYAGLSNDLAAISVSGTLQAKYARDAFGGLLSLQEGTAPAAGTLSDLHGDLIGTYSGTAVTTSTSYGPFGEIAAQTGDRSNLGYQGEYIDPETGKVNMHARWYQPGTGTFASRDTANLDPAPSVRANRYTYADASPLTGIDPTGHSTIDAGSVGGAWGAPYVPGVDYQTAVGIYAEHGIVSGGCAGSGLYIGGCKSIGGAGGGAIACLAIHDSCGGLEIDPAALAGDNEDRFGKLRLIPKLKNLISCIEGGRCLGNSSAGFGKGAAFGAGSRKISEAPMNWNECEKTLGKKTCEVWRKAIQQIEGAKEFVKKCVPPTPGKGTHDCGTLAQILGISEKQWQNLITGKLKESALYKFIDFMASDIKGCESGDLLACAFVVGEIFGGLELKGAKEFLANMPKVADVIHDLSKVQKVKFAAGSGRVAGQVVPKSQAEQLAKWLGYTPARGKGFPKGQRVWECKKGCSGPKYISWDEGGHNGAIFKGASRPEDLFSKKTREGGYDLGKLPNGGYGLVWTHE
ncbi:RHS repeat-associated core domain-containing protein [Nonomuraea sp. NPDC052116]|uniref:RHS repeat-associated core domain-containing protein n=1 Tax=Nonomuraea sp. NPDC052116 TaxID=3155665 RepID=UPI0034282D4E